MMMKMLINAAIASLLVVTTQASTNADVNPLQHFQRRNEAAAKTSYCEIELGWDFVGGDITNVPGANRDSCKAACDAVAECNAFTWTNYKNGTCWLKRSRGQVVPKEGAISASCFPEKQQVCAVIQEVDFVGNDIGSAPGSAAEECCYVCQNTFGCRAYSWTNYNGGTCWLKSTRGTGAVSKNGVKSAEVYPATTYSGVDSSAGSSTGSSSGGYNPSCTHQIGIDYVGHDFANVNNTPSSACCDICKGVPACVAYSWSDYNGGTCWLKDFADKTVAKAGVVSAKVRENAPKCAFAENTDYEGYDLGNSPSKEAGKCCELCKGIRGCAAVSWSNYNGGTCWLKTNVGKIVYKAGVKSARVV